MNNSKVNRRSFIKASALCTSAFVASDYSHAEQSSWLAQDFSTVWDHVTTSTLEYAEAMPENDYKFKPVPEIFSFAEQLLHIVGSNYNLSSRIPQEKKPDVNLDAEGKSKKEIIDILKRSFDYTAKVLESLSEEEAKKEFDFRGGKVNKFKVALLLKDHLTHHKGQLVIYLRLKGIKPPRYHGI